MRTITHLAVFAAFIFCYLMIALSYHQAQPTRLQIRVIDGTISDGLVSFSFVQDADTFALDSLTITEYNNWMNDNDAFGNVGGEEFVIYGLKDSTFHELYNCHLFDTMNLDWVHSVQPQGFSQFVVSIHGENDLAYIWAESERGYYVTTSTDIYPYLDSDQTGFISESYTLGGALMEYFTRPGLFDGYYFEAYD